MGAQECGFCKTKGQHVTSTTPAGHGFCETVYGSIGLTSINADIKNDDIKFKLSRFHHKLYIPLYIIYGFIQKFLFGVEGGVALSHTVLS